MNVSENKKYKVRDAWWWLKYLVSLLVPSIFVVLSVWKQGAFATTNNKALLGMFSNAFLVSGFLTLYVSSFVIIMHGHVFEKLFNGLKKLILWLKEDPIDRKYHNFRRYRRIGKEKTLDFWIWYINIVGVAFLGIAGILFVSFMAA